MNLIAFNRQLILKCFYIKVSFRLQHGKRIWQTKLCNVEIWIEEILTLPKARRVITEILLLLKYQKQIITAVLMGKMLLCCCYLLTAFRRSWIYQELPCIVSLNTSSIGNKIPDWELCWAVDHEFYYRIWNCKSAWSGNKFIRKLTNNINFLTNLPENVITQRWKLFRKFFSPKHFFSNELKSSEKKESLKGEG